MKRTLGPLAAAGVLAGLLAGPFVALGYADAPTSQGWWSSANQGVQPPAPPDVPEDGLLVQGGAARPLAPGVPTVGGTPAAGVSTQALSALTFAVPSGAVVESLVLKLAGDPPASTTVFACAITGPYRPAQNGEFAKRPPYDCARNSVPKLDPAKGTLSFSSDLTGLVQNGSLSLMLVPGDVDRIILQKPGATALVLRRSGTGAPGTAPFDPGKAPAVQGPPSNGGSGSAGPQPSSGFGSAGPPLAGSPGQGGALPTAPKVASPQALPPPALGGPSTEATSQAGRSAVDGSTRTLLLLGLVIVGLAFVLGSRESLAGAGPAPIVPQERGIGRFRQLRDTRAVPL